MSNLVSATAEVHMDEPAFYLSELVQPSPLGAPRRFQIILVIRNDAIAEYRVDLGPASEFTTPEFRIPGGVIDEATGRGEILHTVGELKDIADEMHERAAPVVQTRDIWGEYYDYLDGKRNV
jgi:hypothetical protein